MTDGPVGLVTGAGSGIGRGIARAFAARGAVVVVADIDEETAQRTVDELVESGARAGRIGVDVSSPDSVEAMVDEVMSRYGRLDWAANNAGIQGDVAYTVELTADNFDRVLQVNLKGVWLGLKYEIPAILASGGGAIVNTSSATAVISGPGLAHYSASKHGILGLTKTAAIEYSKAGVRVNAVCPGVVPTSMTEGVIDASEELAERIAAMHPIGRLATVDEVGKSVAWLCSDEASFITGHALLVDGGAVII